VAEEPPAPEPAEVQEPEAVTPAPVVLRRPTLTATGIRLAHAHRLRPVRALVGWRFSAAVALAMVLGGSIAWLGAGRTSGRSAAPPVASLPEAMPPPFEARTAVIEPMPLPGDEPRLSAPEPAAGRTPRTARSSKLDAPARRRIIDLNKQAIAAYDALEPQAALKLLDEALRRSEAMGPRGLDLVARTQNNLGVVLAGGFKQRDQAAQHFRVARAIFPNITPPPELMTPEVEAAFLSSSR
jgi:hypothetical protein